MRGTRAWIGMLTALALFAAPAAADAKRYELREIVHAPVTMSDGVELDGWIGMPDVPDGTRVPVLLHSSPYLNICSTVCFPTVDQRDAAPGYWSDEPHWLALEAWGVPPIELVRAGYAVAFYSVRGTSSSGGCLDYFGTREQDDQVELVRHLAGMPWSTRSVAMGGKSYPGGAAMEAATHEDAPRELKAIVTAGNVVSGYELYHTPQGAAVPLDPPVTSYHAQLRLMTIPSPHGGGGHVTDALLAQPERPCEETAEWAATLTADTYSPLDRNAGFWEPRRLSKRLGRVRAAVLSGQGFHDGTSAASHYFQDADLWALLRNAPKRLVTHGTVPTPAVSPHNFPQEGVATLDPRWAHDTWAGIVLAWLDYYLKGIGEPPRVGRADYQDTGLRWHSSKRWPPREATPRALYLSGSALGALPGSGSRTFLSAPNPANSNYGARTISFDAWQGFAGLCDTEPVTGTAQPRRSLLYVSPPLPEETLIAGNPHAYLRVGSDQPTGLLNLKLVAIPPDFSCDALSDPTPFQPLTRGGADLRFHHGGYVGRDFGGSPLGGREMVRIDLHDLAERVPSGSRLALVASYGETHEEQYATGAPNITLHEGPSHLLLPVVEGKVGGAAPEVTYPPRPFLQQE